MKAAIIILSDPKAGEEALGRMFNRLAAAYDFRGKGIEVGKKASPSSRSE